MEAKRKADEEPVDASKKARGELIAVEEKGGKNQQLIVVRLLQDPHAGPRGAKLSVDNCQWVVVFRALRSFACLVPQLGDEPSPLSLGAQQAH